MCSILKCRKRNNDNNKYINKEKVTNIEKLLSLVWGNQLPESLGEAGEETRTQTQPPVRILEDVKDSSNRWTMREIMIGGQTTFPTSVEKRQTGAK